MVSVADNQIAEEMAHHEPDVSTQEWGLAEVDFTFTSSGPELINWENNLKSGLCARE